MQKRNRLLKEIDKQVRRIEETINVKDSLFHSKGTADMVTHICCELLNNIYGYSLEEAKSLLGIHLIDTEHRVAVLLCEKTSWLKVQETTERLLSYDVQSKIDTLIILIMEYTTAPGIREGYGKSILSLQVLYLPDIMQMISFLPTATLEKILFSLDQQLSTQVHEETVKTMDFPDPVSIACLTPAMQQVLFFFSFLPAEGLNETLLRHALDHSQQRATNELIANNWVVQKDSLLMYNSKVSTPVLEREDSMKPAFAAFLDLLWDFEKSWRWYRVPLKAYKMIFRRLALLFQNAAGWVYSDTVVCARRSAEFWLSVDEYENAKQQVLLALHALDTRSDQQWITAYLLHLIAYCYYMRHQYKDAQQYWSNTLEQCQNIPVPPSDLAVAYHYSGISYIKMKEYTSAIEQFQNEIKLLETERTCGDIVFPHLGLAQAYRELGHIYGLQNDEKKQNFYYHKALAAEQESAQLPDSLLNNLFNPPPKHLLPAAPSASAWFKSGSRDQELDELIEKLQHSDSPLFIYGAGGVGKTEVAIQLACRLKSTKRFFYIRYCGAPSESEAMFETILHANFSNYLFQKTDSADHQKEYQDRINILRDEYPGTVLIIDDFYRPGKTLEDLQSERSYSELVSTGIQLIFVTRSDVHTENSVKINPLNEDILIELMRDELGGKPICDEVLSDIVHTIGDHPILISIAANTIVRMEDSSLDQLLSVLHSEIANPDDLSEPTSVGKTQPILPRIDNFLKTMLSLSGMDTADFTALGCAALLPEEGMQRSLFLECIPLTNLPAEKRFTAMRLIDYGYLRCVHDRLMIHPTIREFCLQHLVQSDDVYRAYCMNLWKKFSINRACKPEIVQQIAESFLMASAKLHDAAVDLPMMAAMCWTSLGMHHKALHNNLCALELWEQSFGSSNLALAKIHQNTGDTYRELGILDKAQMHYEAALDICNAEPKSRHLQKYYVNTSIFDISIRQGEYIKALHCAQENLKYVKHHQHRYESLAAAYFHICQAYIKMEDYEHAYENMNLLLDICKSPELKDKASLSRYYGCAAYIYIILAERNNDRNYWKNALEYQRKALVIHEKLLAPDHPDLATSYNNMAIIFNTLDEHYKALEYRLKAMEIREKVLPLNHPSLASVYSSVSDSYYALGDLDHSLEYREKALLIRKRMLPEMHPDLISSYSRLGYTLLERREYAKARDVLKYLLKILNKDPAKDPMLVAITNSRIGLTYSKQGYYKAAESYSRNALTTFRMISEPNSPNLATACSDLGYVLIYQKKYSEALVYLTEAQEIARMKYSSSHPEMLQLNAAIEYIRICCHE